MPIDQDERTEPATPRKKQEARSRGQIPRSHDLAAAVVLLAGLIIVNALASDVWALLMRTMREGLSPTNPWSVDEVVPFAVRVAGDVFRQLWPILALVALSVAVVLFAQVGPLLTWSPLAPSLSRLDPIAGLRRMFSASSAVMAGLGFLKVALVAAIVWIAMTGSAAPILYAFTLEVQDSFLLGGRLTFRLGVTVAIVFIFLALLDYAWRRYQHTRSLRMTKEEVKDELRSMEGDPAIKQRRRRIQFQLHLQRIKKDVPRADVIISNPTHFAVALSYDSQSMPAPKVVARGADFLALRIRQIAAEHGIPIVERPPLARALYGSVEVGQYVPERFYQAIAEILAYVYELSGRTSLLTATR